PPFCPTSCIRRPLWGPASRTPKPRLLPAADGPVCLTKQRFIEPCVTARTDSRGERPTEIGHARTPRVPAETENLNSINALGRLARHLHYVQRGAGTRRRHIRANPSKGGDAKLPV